MAIHNEFTLHCDYCGVWEECGYWATSKANIRGRYRKQGWVFDMKTGKAKCAECKSKEK
jgi:hypothetical protein